MPHRRSSVVQTFREDDYTRLAKLGTVIKGIGAYAVVMGAMGVWSVISGSDIRGTGASLAVLIIVAVVWWGFAFFAFLVARDATDATDTHVVLEVSASIAIAIAVSFSHFLGFIGGFGAISADTWQAISFALGWPLGYLVYVKLGEHFRSEFRLKRKLSVPPKWMILIFTITLWIALTALAEDLVSAAIGNWRHSIPMMLLVIGPALALAGGAYYLICETIGKAPEETA